MNIASVNVGGSKGGQGVQTAVSQPLSLGQKGQIIEGTITKVSKGISINFSGREVTVPKSAVQNAKEGEIRKFEIMEVSDKSIALKEVGSNIRSVGVMSTVVKTDSFGRAEQFSKAFEEKKKQDTKQPNFKQIVDKMTKEDYQELSKEAGSLESYGLEQLDRAIERIKEQRLFKREALEGQIEKQEEYSQGIEKIAIKNQVEGSVSEQISSRLVSANLPATTERILKVQNAMEMGKSVGNLTDRAMTYLIRREMEPTIENLYQAQYTGEARDNSSSQKNWELLMTQVEDVIVQAGQAVNETTLEQAKWLFFNNLPITDKSMKDLNTLQQIKSGVNEKFVVNQIIKAMEKGITPEAASLDNSNYILADQAVKDFQSIEDEAIWENINNNNTVNLNNLKETQQKNRTVDIFSISKEDIGFVIAKRQLEEIRLKMTVEAGQKLIGKGINLNTDQLEIIVEELRQIENEYYRSLLQEGNVIETPESVDLLRETDEKVKDLYEIPAFVLGSTLRQRDLQTVNTLHSAGHSMKVQMDKADQTYEALKTSPRKDLGDSMEKAFQNIDEILEDLVLESTDANRRAVRILAYNQMEITKESVMEVKDYDYQVKTLMKNLQPAITVEMIKQGINPLETPLNQLMEQIGQIRQEMGASEEAVYSNYLWKLERKEGISQEERKSYIGVYRLLNNIEKTKGAAIGAVLQAGQELTLKNLLTAVRTIKSGGMDALVDDHFGALEKLTFEKETITDQIGAAYLPGQNIRNQGLVKDLLEEITPDKLEVALQGEKESFLDMSLERLQEETDISLEKSVIEEEFLNNSLKQVDEVAGSSRDAIAFLKNYEIPLTVGYIFAAKEFFQGESLVAKIKKKEDNFSENSRKIISQLPDNLEDSLGDGDTLRLELDKVDEIIDQVIGQEYSRENITSSEVKDLINIQRGIELARVLRKKEYYEIPLITGEEVTTIKITVIGQQQEQGKLHVGMNSAILGRIEADFIVKDSSLKGLILCDSRQGLSLLNEEKETFLNEVERLDLQVKQLDYGFDREVSGKWLSQTMTQSQEVTKTRTLFQVAKIFVKSIKEIEKRGDV